MSAISQVCNNKIFVSCRAVVVDIVIAISETMLDSTTSYYAIPPLYYAKPCSTVQFRRIAIEQLHNHRCQSPIKVTEIY